MANIGRKSEQPIQNMQHFISESPWSARALIGALQDDIGAEEAFAESVLVIDESADAKAGEMSAGAGRQRNGRLGKVDLCQVGVFATLATPQAHCWVDGELFIPEDWFAGENAAKRKRAGIPEDRTFQTKTQLAETIILRCRDEGCLPFVAVDMDSFYGRKFALRKKLQAEQISSTMLMCLKTRLSIWKNPRLAPSEKMASHAKFPKSAVAEGGQCAI